jgi:hypothetical protein
MDGSTPMPNGRNVAPRRRNGGLRITGLFGVFLVILLFATTIGVSNYRPNQLYDPADLAPPGPNATAEDWEAHEALLQEEAEWEQRMAENAIRANFVFGWAAFWAVLCSIVALRNRRNTIGWGLLGALFAPLTLALLVYLSHRKIVRGPGRWSLKGDYLESSCAEVDFQPTRGRSLPPAHDDACRSALAFNIREGRLKDVNLDGLGAVLILNWPGNQTLAQGNLISALYLDERASPEQGDALQTIFWGAAGGVFEGFAALTKQFHGPKSAHIRFE